MNTERRHRRLGEKLPLWGGGIFALPVIVFIICAAVNGLPEQTIINVRITIFQYIMTMITITCIPFLLWFIRKERFTNKVTYKWAVISRLAFFEIITLIDIAAFFLIPNASFFYLAVITYLSMFFARR